MSNRYSDASKLNFAPMCHESFFSNSFPLIVLSTLKDCQEQVIAPRIGIEAWGNGSSCTVKVLSQGLGLKKRPVV